MNLDLLTKLVKLANNNPNEHEANLAARKVCKLIEEANFKFNGAAQQYTPGPTIRTASNPPGPEYEWVKKQYTKPSPTGRNTAEPAYTGSVYDYINETFRDFEGGNPAVDFNWTGPHVRAQKEKRPLACSKCGVEQQTAFVGPPQVYVCNACIWKEYQAKNG